MTLLNTPSSLSGRPRRLLSEQETARANTDEATGAEKEGNWFLTPSEPWWLTGGRTKMPGDRWSLFGIHFEQTSCSWSVLRRIRLIVGRSLGAQDLCETLKVEVAVSNKPDGLSFDHIWFGLMQPLWWNINDQSIIPGSCKFLGSHCASDRFPDNAVQ